MVLKKGKLLGSVFLESGDPDRMITPTCEQVSATFETLAGPHAENALDLDSKRPPTSHLKDTMSTEQKDKLEEMIEKHKMLFMQTRYDFGRTELIQYRIDLKPDAKPHKEPPRRIKWVKRKQLEETLQELQEGGNIKESLSPWGNVVVRVRKKRTSDLRMCIDFRRLN